MAEVHDYQGRTGVCARCRTESWSADADDLLSGVLRMFYTSEHARRALGVDKALSVINVNMALAMGIFCPNLIEAERRPSPRIFDDHLVLVHVSETSCRWSLVVIYDANMHASQQTFFNTLLSRKIRGTTTAQDSRVSRCSYACFPQDWWSLSRTWAEVNSSVTFSESHLSLGRLGKQYLGRSISVTAYFSFLKYFYQIVPLSAFAYGTCKRILRYWTIDITSLGSSCWRCRFSTLV